MAETAIIVAGGVEIFHDGTDIKTKGVGRGDGVCLVTTNQDLANVTNTSGGQVVPLYAAVDATNDVAITVAQGSLRQITACGNGKKVKLPATAPTGFQIKIFRPAIGATTSSLITDSAGTTTYMTMTANKKAMCECYFDGTAWSVVPVYQEA